MSVEIKWHGNRVTAQEDHNGRLLGYDVFLTSNRTPEKMAAAEKEAVRRLEKMKATWDRLRFGAK